MEDPAGDDRLLRKERGITKDDKNRGEQTGEVKARGACHDNKYNDDNDDELPIVS